MTYYYTLATPLMFGGKLPAAPVFDSKAAAVEAARLANRQGEYRGRGVKAVPCDTYGNVNWRAVR